MQSALGLDEGELLQYRDPLQVQSRVMRLGQRPGQAQLHACMLVGDTNAQNWILPLLQQGAQAPRTLAEL